MYDAHICTIVTLVYVLVYVLNGACTAAYLDVDMRIILLQKIRVLRDYPMVVLRNPACRPWTYVATIIPSAIYNVS